MTPKTLDEIIEEAKAEGKNPWELRLVKDDYEPNSFYVPYFSTGWAWYGKFYWSDNTKYSANIYNGDEHKIWYHYQEPKPKKKYALYAITVGFRPSSVVVLDNEIVASTAGGGKYPVETYEIGKEPEGAIKVPGTEFFADE